jgi:hypothetical protein
MTDKGSGRNRSPTATKLVRTTVYLRPDESNALKLAAGERAIAASEIIRQALRQFLGLPG